MSKLRSPLALFMLLALSGLGACTPEEPSGDDEGETGEPLTCLDTDTPGADITINSDAQMEELALSGCVAERVLVSGGAVTSLAGLSELRQVGILEIRYNPVLDSFAGIEGLERVDHLIITGNNQISELPEFPALALGKVTITSNDLLTDLGSFPAATQLAELEITGNDLLTDYSGFEQLSSISGDTILHQNPLITDFAGFEALTSIGGNLDIQDNPTLESFSGLGLESVGGNFTVLSNAALSECIVDDFAASISIAGATVVGDNMVANCD